MHLVLAAAFAAGFTVAYAQDSAAPATEPLPSSTEVIPIVPGGAPEATATPSASPAPSSPPSADTAQPGINEPTPLIPQQGFGPAPKEAPSPEVPAAPAGVPQVTPTPAPAKGTAEALRRAVRMRQLKTQVEQEPEVVHWLEVANCARTAEGRRVAMRNHYTLIAQKVEKLDPSLKNGMEAWLYPLLFSEEQHRVRPSKLIEDIHPIPGSSSKDHAAAANANVSPAPGAAAANATPAAVEAPTPLEMPQTVGPTIGTLPDQQDFSGGR